jgi:hypothetical protein
MVRITLLCWPELGGDLADVDPCWSSLWTIVASQIDAAWSDQFVLADSF